MNMNFILLFAGLSLFNVIMQTIKSLCTIKSSTFVAACINALAYGLYTYVIVFTNSDGLPLWGKALITASANFFGVYLANILFNKVFNKEMKWKIEISVPNSYAGIFTRKLTKEKIEWYECGRYHDEYTCYAVFAPNSKTSKHIKELIPARSKYNVVECVKQL